MIISAKSQFNKYEQIKVEQKSILENKWAFNIFWAPKTQSSQLYIFVKKTVNIYIYKLT